MSNWLDNDADRDLEFDRNGGELFRNLKAACSAVVDTYNQRYVPGGAELIDCSPVNPNCFRVRLPKSGNPERFVEMYFRPEMRTVTVNRSAIPPQQQNTAPPLYGTVKITVGHDGLTFEAPNDSRAPNGASHQADAQQLSKEILEPLLFPGGIRPVPIK